MDATHALTLTEFLLARIAEDEESAREATPGAWHVEPRRHYDVIWGSANRVTAGRWCGDPNVTHIARHDPARVLAECGAKRRIVERLSVPDPHAPVEEDCTDCWTLYMLALPYADHPNYHEEWKV